MPTGKTNADYTREWRLKNAEKIRQYRKANQKRRRLQLAEWKKRNPEKVRKIRNEWAAKNREHIRIYHKKWESQNPKDRHRYNHSAQQAARMALRVEIRSGRISRPDKCSNCGRPCKPHGHHPDYSKPLEIIWLCIPCHVTVHTKGKKP